MLAAASPVLAEPADEPAVHAGTPAPTAAGPIDQLTLDDDLIAATGLRPIAERRVEAAASTGTDATHRAAARATDTLGGFGVELAGNAMTSDVLREQNDASARIEHASERDHVRLAGGYLTGHTGTAVQSFTTDDHNASYGAAWTAWRAPGRLDLELAGASGQLRDTRDRDALDLTTSSVALRAGFTSRRLVLLGLDHEFSASAGIVQASGVAITDPGDEDSLMHGQGFGERRHGQHRFLHAYLRDTIRVIESLDISAGFVFEKWRWLTSLTPLSAHDEVTMDVDAPEEISALIVGPTFGAIYRLGPSVALTADGYRRLRAPTWLELMRPVDNSGTLTAAADNLHAATVTGGEAGPAIATGAFAARVVGYYHDVAAPIVPVSVSAAERTLENLGRAREAGLDASASVRLAKPWLAGIGYTFTATRITNGGRHPELTGAELPQTPRHHATASLAYDQPRIVTLTSTLHYVDRRYDDANNTIVRAPFTVVDAMAARKLTHGLAGFVSVENLLDRRYAMNLAGVDTIGAPRLVQVGVRLDSARW